MEQVRLASCSANMNFTQSVCLHGGTVAKLVAMKGWEDKIRS